MRGRVIIAGGGTGGHVYPALNLADAIRTRSGEGVEILLIGAERGIEARIYPERDVPHRLLPVEPLYRSRPWRNWRQVSGGLRSIRGLSQIFREFEPDLVVGTGGYAAGPTVAWALLHRLRTAIQEQNSRPGLTTRWLAPWVDQLHLGYPEARERLRPGRKTTVRAHGNPIQWPESRPDPVSARRTLRLSDDGPVVLVIGGSQGATAINAAMVRAVQEVASGRVPGLPTGSEVLWATGHEHHDAVKRRLGGAGQVCGVRTVPYIERMELALAVASLAVSRAGAMAVAELCAWGVPALLVPYPHAAGGHQLENARALEQSGAARVIEERQMRADFGVLWRTVRRLLEDKSALEEMGRRAASRGRPEAARRIAADLLSLLDSA